MTRRMFRYEVPVDDRKHVFYLTGGPVHLAATTNNVVEFWAEYEDDKPSYPRAYQVFVTGLDLPDAAAWVGTCDRTSHGPVWHLYEVAP